VVAVGTPVWRKGPDLFVEVARQLTSRVVGRAVLFMWLGADTAAGHPDLTGPLEDVERLGLRNVVTFVPPTDRVFDHLKLADAFVLTSREDAFPLVCLEAGSVGLPIVCFDAGGIPGLVGDDAGVVVPFPRLGAMADALAGLAAEPQRAAELGQAAARRVRAEHDIALVGPTWRHVLDSWASR
jgi:glycosyltransferase involved in cell wall biosynthesis